MDDVTVPVIDRLIGLSPARTLDVDGFTHIDKDKSCVLFTPPVPNPVGVDTLSGFVKLLEVGLESFDPTKTIVHVKAFNQVSLRDLVSDKYGRRQSYVIAEAPKPEREFKFNTYITQEEFNIALRSMFVETDQLLALIGVSGNLAKEMEVRQRDDGFTQEVTAKTGVHMVTEVTVKPRVTLQPFRTFLEVEQPSGDYIFRVKNDERQGNLCALFEADGGRWKLTAMNTIKEWLSNQLKGSPVETLNNLPVIS
jgi:hypothetical protein